MQVSAVVKAKAYLRLLTAKENLLYVILLYIAAISTFSAIPFYPLLFVPFLAVVPAFIAYSHRPEFGVITLGAMALPAFFYQSTAFAWLYLFFFSLMLFEVFDKWREIIMLFLLVSLPFTPFPMNLLAGFHYLFMLITVLHFSSKRSAFIVTSSLFLIFLLQTLWQTFIPFYPLSTEGYLTHPLLERKPFILFSTFSAELSQALANVVDFQQLLAFGAVVDVVLHNVMRMLFQDTALIQMLFWNILLFTAAFLTGRVKDRWMETKAAAFLLLAIPFYYLIYTSMGQPYPAYHALYVALSVGIFYVLERNGFRFSREVEAIKREEEKDLAPFGVRELTLSKDVKGLEDVGGYEDVKKELMEAIMLPLQKPELAYVYGLKPPRGILLFGPPGTGKTFLMKALAKEIDYPFFYVKSTAVMSKWYGESERRIREIFERARKKAPAILFFDEIDAIARDRGRAGEHTASLVTALLQELDGFREDKPIIFVAATNRPDVIDKALLRPGRIDKIIYMRPPNFEERKAIFAKKLSPYPTKDIDLDRLAKLTERFSGADIDRVVREAVLKVAERAKRSGKVEPITQQDLEEIIGKTKPSITTSMLEMYEAFKTEFERRTEEKERPPQLTFKDVVDLEKVKKALKRAIELPLKHPELVERYGLEPVKGLLLFGPPGTGKTYIIKAAAGEFGVPLISLSAAELLSQGEGKAAEVLKEAFNKARDAAPAILFIDEIDTIGSRATTPALFNQLLQEMDGLKSNKGVVVVGATNEPWKVDVALLRPGRFDAILYVEPPNKAVRKALLAYYLGKFASLYDLDRLAELTKGFSSADIKALANDIKAKLLLAEMEGSKLPSQEEIEEIVKKRRPSITPALLKRYKTFLEEYGERVLE